MPRVRIAVCLLLFTFTLAAGCASDRPTATMEAPPTSRETGEAIPSDVAADAGRGRLSPAHPFSTHAAWVQPSWCEEHPVATIAGSAAIGAGLALLAVGIVVAYVVGHVN